MMTNNGLPRRAPLILSQILSLFALSLCLFLTGCKSAQESSRANLDEARKLISQGSYAAAFLRLNQALSEAPRDPDVHLNLGWLYLYTNDDHRAEAEWRKAEELAPKRPDVDHLRGSILMDLAQQAESKGKPQEAGRLEKDAVVHLERALKGDSQNHQLYFDLANDLIALNETERALTVLDKGFDYIPKKDLETQVDFEVASCTAHAKLGRYEEAIEDCRQAEEFTPTEAGKQRIKDLIENMRLLNPPEASPQSGILQTEPMQTNSPASSDSGSD
jgi:Flp pilus assembly protein TadD